MHNPRGSDGHHRPKWKSPDELIVTPKLAGSRPSRPSRTRRSGEVRECGSAREPERGSVLKIESPRGRALTAYRVALSASFLVRVGVDVVPSLPSLPPSGCACSSWRSFPLTTTSLAPPFVLTRPLAHRLNRPPTPVAPLAHRRRSFSPPQPVASGPSRVATGEPASALRLGLGPTFRLPSRLPGRSPVRHALRRLPFRRAALPQPGPAQERPSDWTPSHRRVPPDDSGPTSLARPPARPP